MAEAKATQQRMLELVAIESGTPLDAVSAEKTLEQHGLDSLSRVEFLMAAEDEFHLEIPDVDGQRLDDQPVQEWVQYVEARRAAAAA